MNVCACAVPAVAKPETAAKAFAEEFKKAKGYDPYPDDCAKGASEKAAAINGEAATANPEHAPADAANADATPAPEHTVGTNAIGQDSAMGDSGAAPTGAANAEWIAAFTTACNAITKAARYAALLAAKAAADKVAAQAAKRAAFDEVSTDAEAEKAAGMWQVSGPGGGRGEGGRAFRRCLLV